MDGLSEDSPLLQAVLVADYVQRTLGEHKFLLLFASFLFGFYLHCGCWADLSILIGLLCWLCGFKPTIPLIPEANSQRVGVLTVITLVTFAIRRRIQRPAVVKEEAIGNILGGPHLIPARTTHTRLFPQKHSFSYHYLLVGTPVGCSGNVNGMVSVDVSGMSHSRIFGNRAWFDIDPVDHLQRAQSGVGLRGKLDCYLQFQNIDPSRYPHAYLVTAAGCLGHRFSPASFWFLYTPEKILSAMLVEMHSIFGERHSYLVERDFEAEAKLIKDSVNNSQAAGLRFEFKATWQKDFHVSPFNSRKGSYSIRALDPLGPNMEGFLGIDITMNLVSSKGRPKLATKLFSVGDSIDPGSMSYVQKLKFLICWFWGGLLTFPRFVKEAAVLFGKPKFHFWYRPEPLKESVGRLANEAERRLEKVFREYLRHLVEQSSSALAVRYIPSGIENPAEEVFRSRFPLDTPGATGYTTIKILTPVFYSRFVYYAHDSEAIFCELAESHTVWMDRPELLPKIFLKKASPPLHAPSIFDYLSFQLIRRLRRRPEKIERPMTSASIQLPPKHRLVDIRGFRMSSLDAFVLSHCDDKTKTSYILAVTKLFVVDRVAFGKLELVDLMMLVGRVGASWALASLIN